jgi:hypothetical protein
MNSEFKDLDPRLMWAALSYSNRLFLLFFCGVSVYTLKLAFHVMTRLRKMEREGDSRADSGVSYLRKRLGNLRQLHLLTLYLLWACVAFNVPNAFNILGDSIWPVLTKLAFLCYVYTRILMAFVLLHSVQWFTSSRVEVFESRDSANFKSA